MSLYIQYHNCDKRGLKYLISPGEQCGISTRRPNAKNAQGTVLLIVGMGRPRQFFLWEAFDIEGVDEEADGNLVVFGPGWQLCPPQRLEGPEFEQFKSACANFVGFRSIDDLPYSHTLKKLAQKYRSRRSDARMQPFLAELLLLLKEGTEDHRRVLKFLEQRPAAPKAARRQSSTKSIKQLPPASQSNGEPLKMLRALSVRQPSAEAIMRGIKKIEYRSRPTRIRGRIQIYASQARYSAEDETEMLQEYGIKDVCSDALPRGVLIGTVEIFDCTEDYGEFQWHLRRPQRAAKLLKPKKRPQPVWFNPF